MADYQFNIWSLPTTFRMDIIIDIGGGDKAMILPSVYQLSIIGVVDAGIANHERIVMRPAEAVNLAQFGLFLARKGANELVTPLTDNFFWFGEFIAEPPS